MKMSNYEKTFRKVSTQSNREFPNSNSCSLGGGSSSSNNSGGNSSLSYSAQQRQIGPLGANSAADNASLVSLISRSLNYRDSGVSNLSERQSSGSPSLLGSSKPDLADHQKSSRESIDQQHNVDQSSAYIQDDDDADSDEQERIKRLKKARQKLARTLAATSIIPENGSQADSDDSDVEDFVSEDKKTTSFASNPAKTEESSSTKRRKIDEEEEHYELMLDVHEDDLMEENQEEEESMSESEELDKRSWGNEKPDENAKKVLFNETLSGGKSDSVPDVLNNDQSNSAIDSFAWLPMKYKFNPLTLVIMDVDYPQKMLTNGDYDLFRQVTVKEIDQTPAKHWPRFAVSFYRKGVFIVTALDETSKDWFYQRFESIAYECKLNLDVKKAKDIPNTVKATVVVIDLSNVETFLQRLQNFNPTLSTDRWRVVKIEQLNNSSRKSVLELRFSAKEADALEAIDDRPYYDLGRLTFMVKRDFADQPSKPRSPRRSDSNNQKIKSLGKPQPLMQQPILPPPKLPQSLLKLAVSTLMPHPQPLMQQTPHPQPVPPPPLPQPLLKQTLIQQQQQPPPLPLNPPVKIMPKSILKHSSQIAKQPETEEPRSNSFLESALPLSIPNKPSSQQQPYNPHHSHHHQHHQHHHQQQQQQQAKSDTPDYSQPPPKLPGQQSYQYQRPLTPDYSKKPAAKVTSQQVQNQQQSYHNPHRPLSPDYSKKPPKLSSQKPYQRKSSLSPDYSSEFPQEKLKLSEKPPYQPTRPLSPDYSLSQQKDRPWQNSQKSWSSYSSKPQPKLQELLSLRQVQRLPPDSRDADRVKKSWPQKAKQPLKNMLR